MEAAEKAAANEGVAVAATAAVQNLWYKAIKPCQLQVIEAGFVYYLPHAKCNNAGPCAYYSITYYVTAFLSNKAII